MVSHHDADTPMATDKSRNCCGRASGPNLLRRLGQAFFSFSFFLLVPLGWEAYGNSGKVLTVCARIICKESQGYANIANDEMTAPVIGCGRLLYEIKLVTERVTERWGTSLELVGLEPKHPIEST